jgi:hypothetical protein
MSRVRSSVVWLARRLVRLVAALVAGRLAVNFAGELVVAAVLGPTCVVWGLGRWAALERRLESHRTSATQAVVARGPGRLDLAASKVRSPRRWRGCRPVTSRCARTRPTTTQRRHGRRGGEHDDR